MACRSVPVQLELAGIRDQLAPWAWIFNYANPTSIVTTAVDGSSACATRAMLTMTAGGTFSVCQGGRWRLTG
jgi:hypothetical protein